MEREKEKERKRKVDEGRKIEIDTCYSVHDFNGDLDIRARKVTSQIQPKRCKCQVNGLKKDADVVKEKKRKERERERERSS